MLEQTSCMHKAQGDDHNVQHVAKGGVWLVSILRHSFFWQYPFSVSRWRDQAVHPQLWQPICAVSFAYTTNIGASRSPFVALLNVLDIISLNNSRSKLTSQGFEFKLAWIPNLDLSNRSLDGTSDPTSNFLILPSLLCRAAQHPLHSPLFFVGTTRKRQSIIWALTLKLFSGLFSLLKKKFWREPQNFVWYCSSNMPCFPLSSCQVHSIFKKKSQYVAPGDPCECFKSLL